MKERLAIWQEENAQVDAFFQGLVEHLPEEETEPGAFERVWNNIQSVL